MSVPSQWLLVIALGTLVVGAAVTSFFHRNWRLAGWTTTGFMTLASAMLWMLAVRATGGGSLDTWRLFGFDLLGASLAFHVDRLSAVFLFVIPLVGLCATLYAIEYMAKLHGERSASRYYPFSLLLMATTVCVVTTSDLFFFFVFWEMMTLTSWAFVWFEREDETKVRAAWVYFVATHVASAGILIASLLIYSKSGSFAFADAARALDRLSLTSIPMSYVVMGLFLIGFVTKAGVFPFGGWLPQAYPAAPSPASAFFAGSMTKLGIYGVVRIFFDLLTVSHATSVWGMTIAILGVASIFVGTLTALRQDDSKRILSFHMIGQVGYMLLPIGIALFFLDKSLALSVVALVAGLFHTINNAFYKSLLFLNVGAAEYGTGLRDLNKMGGFGSVMPVTMTAAIVASLSIAGIPPFNGFASKWLIYQSAFRGGFQFPIFLLAGLVAMFVSLLTLASFMKLLGAIFLGKMDPRIKLRSEVPGVMKFAQIVLSAVCVIFGIFPVLALWVLYGAAGDAIARPGVPPFRTLFGADPAGISLDWGATSPVAVWNPAYALLALLFCSLLSYGISRAGLATRRRTEGWYGGEEHTADEVRFRSHGFCLPFKQAMPEVYPSIRMPKLPVFETLHKFLDLDKWLYDPLVARGGSVTDRLSRTHTGVPHVYMAWQLVGMILVFAILFIAGQM